MHRERMRRFTMLLRATRMLHSYVGDARKVQRYTRTWSAYGEREEWSALRGIIDCMYNTYRVSQN